MSEATINTKLNLMYRDGDNYKAFLNVVVAGAITAPQIAQIRTGLDDGEFIIANQVQLPTPSFNFRGQDNWPNEELDHVWTTLPDFEGDLKPTELHTQAPPTEHNITIEQLAAAIATAKWDVAAEWDRMKNAV